MKKLKPTKKPNPHARPIVVTFKVNHEELRKILGKAHTWSEGNVSEWLRWAGINGVPSKKDLEK